MRDKFGFFRGKCGPDCLCIEYKTTPGGPVRCTECNHTPIQHESLGIVAACNECSECEHFDHSYGEYAFCDYCECSIQKHCSAPPESSLPPSYAVSTAPPAESPPKVATQIGNSYNATVVPSIPNNATQIQQQPQYGMGQVDPMGASRMDTFSEMNQHMLTTPMDQTGQIHPTNYMNPMAPTNYANPMNPMAPTNYVNPMNPMAPTNYANPMNPMAPTNYVNPMNPMAPTNYANPMNPTAPTNYMMNTKKCAIQECQEASFFDPTTGGTQECCSVQHAMEHERRKAMGSNIMKGITHCLLPGCNKHVWPFMNYCSKTHATAGMAKGLLPPDPNAGSRPQKEQSEGVCALPGCQRPRYLDDGKEHPFCSRSHGTQAKSQGMAPESAEKPGDRCAIPGCWKPKFVDGGVTHYFCSKSHRKKAESMGSKIAVDPNAKCDLPSCNMPKLIDTDHQQDYCSKTHADLDAPRRDAAILTDRKEVEKWLKTFGNFTVTDIKENPHAKPGGELFKKFQEKYKSLPKANRQTALAFHGTAVLNIDNICQNGYDASLRRGQAHGPGEYFATTPDVSLGYCRGGKKMLLNELLLGVQNQHHTQSGNIIVMKDPAHDLPRFVLTFQ